MAFIRATFKEIGGPGRSAQGGQSYSVFSTSDSIATMLASGYLNEVAGNLHLRDLILLSGTDGSQFAQVTSNDGTTVTLASGGTVTSGNTVITGTLDVTGLSTLINAVLTGTLSVSGTSTLSGLLIYNQAAQALTGAGTVDITSRVTEFTSDDTLNALTLADGAVGQRKTVIHVSDGGAGELTPANALGYTDITFTTAGESVELEFRTGGWAVIGIGGLSASLPVVA